MTSNKIRAAVKERSPLIHAITNPISINQCANTAISLGAMPIMAEHPKEVAQITKTAQALLLNLGNITDIRMQSMLISSKEAKENNIPVIIDTVGVSCSSLRRDFLFKLLEENHPSLLKGNYSEIYSLNNCLYKSNGVDSETGLAISTVQKAAINLAEKYSTIILASGKCDIITDGKKLFYIHNGTPALSSVTGTGCMLGMLCSIFMSVCPDINSVCTAAAVLGICGEMAEAHKGSGSFMINLLDNLSLLSDNDFEENVKMEEIKIEDI